MGLLRTTRIIRGCASDFINSIVSRKEINTDFNRMNRRGVRSLLKRVSADNAADDGVVVKVNKDVMPRGSDRRFISRLFNPFRGK